MLADLMMPAEQSALVDTVFVRNNTQGDNSENQAISDALRASQQEGAAQFRYKTADGQSTYRVVVDLFVSEQAAAERFRSRHLPEALAMTEPYDAGDAGTDGFIFATAYLGFRVGRVAVEMRAKPPHDDLAAFGRDFARHVEAACGKRCAALP